MLWILSCTGSVLTTDLDGRQSVLGERLLLDCGEFAHCSLLQLTAQCVSAVLEHAQPRLMLRAVVLAKYFAYQLIEQVATSAPPVARVLSLLHRQSARSALGTREATPTCAQNSAGAPARRALQSRSKPLRAPLAGHTNEQVIWRPVLVEGVDRDRHARTNVEMTLNVGDSYLTRHR